MHLAQTYAFDTPLTGRHHVTFAHSLELPSQVRTGRLSGSAAWKVELTFTQQFVQALHTAGATVLEGSLRLGTAIESPETTAQIAIPLTLPPTGLPAAGTLLVHATGTAPPLSFSRAGTGLWSVSKASFHLRPQRADGSPTSVGGFNADALLGTGEPTLLGEFTIAS
ncbi:DUF6801 domain-containing protein [Streptomyces sp. NPDC092359]|uniref:DUF6801 domain-containing protein n=1 Tax=Streptomyces sp. NPDC092359 TaxID=3366014 RepID=UPI0037FB298C